MALILIVDDSPTEVFVMQKALEKQAALAADPVHPNEIIVSAANYAEASPAVLAKLFRHPVDQADPPPPPAHAHPVQELHTDFRAKYECRCRQRVSEHRTGSDYRRTGYRAAGFSRSRVDDVMLTLIIARGTDRLV